MPRTITLTFIFIKLWPFFDLEFQVKVCVQATVQTHNFNTTYTTALKLGTVVHQHVPSVYAKNHNSNFHFDQIMAVFDLEFQVKVSVQASV